MVDDLAFGPFLALADDARAVLAARARRVRYARGQHLLRVGERPDFALAVVGGRVRATAEDGKVLATMSAPALVGELAVMSGGPRTADVVALDPVRALRIDKAELLRLVAEDAEFGRTLEAFAETRQATSFLRRQGPFGDLPSSEIDRLAAHMRPFHAAAGDVLIRQGERGDDVLLVRSGELEAMRDDGTGDRMINRIGPGAIIGEMAALTGSPRSATVRASTDVDALVIPGADVRRVVGKHRELLDRVTSVMQARHSPERSGRHHVEPAPDDPNAVILHDPDRAAYLRLDRQALAIYEDLDGERTLRDLALRHFERTGTIDPHAVFATIAALQVAGFASTPRIAREATDGRIVRAMDLILAPRIELRDADRVATTAHRILAPLFTRPAAIAEAMVGTGGLLLSIPVLRTASPADFGIAGLAVAFLGLFLGGIGHEAAHALAAKAEGSRIGRAGMGLFWFAPVVYVDTSSTWAIPRWARIRVNAAGPLFNLTLAGACGLLARLTTGTAQDILVWLALTNVALVVFNLSPLLEFDGYYVLADLTDTNALRRKALAFVFRDWLDHPRAPRSRREAGFVAYTAAAFLYVIAMSIVAVAGVTNVASGVLSSFVAGDLRGWIATLVGLGTAAFLVLPFVTEAVEARKRAGAAVA